MENQKNNKVVITILIIIIIILSILCLLIATGSISLKSNNIEDNDKSYTDNNNDNSNITYDDLVTYLTGEWYFYEKYEDFVDPDGMHETNFRSHSLVLNEDGTASVSTGCNRCSGGHTDNGMWSIKDDNLYVIDEECISTGGNCQSLWEYKIDLKNDSIVYEHDSISPNGLNTLKKKN